MKWMCFLAELKNISSMILTVHNNPRKGWGRKMGNQYEIADFWNLNATRRRFLSHMSHVASGFSGESLIANEQHLCSACRPHNRRTAPRTRRIRTKRAACPKCRQISPRVQTSSTRLPRRTFRRHRTTPPTKWCTLCLGSCPIGKRAPMDR